MTSSFKDNGKIPLGEKVPYSSNYDPSLLYRIQRPVRADLDPAVGFDRWVAYEFTCLSPGGSPKCCILEIIVPASSKFIVESKSLKLYLGSFAQEKFASLQEATRKVSIDLADLLECKDISIRSLEIEERTLLQISSSTGTLLDDKNFSCTQFENPSSELITVSSEICQETLYSHLFRSLCPVTEQPDYATVVIDYRGNRINPESLLQYLVSYRNHAGFHETCCEKIFDDIVTTCKPEQLTVACYFNRRGGIEINPVRSSISVEPAKYCNRFARQ